MANKLRIKRRVSGAVGAPASLENAELAFNEVDNTLYYGKGTGGAGGTATTIEAIGGDVKANVNSPTFTGVPAAPTPAPGTNTTQVATTAFVTAAVTAGSVADGDKGDIVVSGSGTAWAIDTGVVSNAKLADMATATFKGRNAAGTGAPEDLSVAVAKALLNLAGNNTGDQTITLTGDVTGSGTGSFAATIAANSVSLAKMADVASGTVFYRKTAATGDPEVQTLATLKTDLGLTGNNTGDQTITLTGHVVGSGTGSFATTIQPGVITNAMQANMAANTISGNNTGAAGAPLDLTVAQTKAMLALDQVNNTTDANKPVSTAQATAIALMVPLTQKGAANGVATLGADSKIPAAQLPALAITDTFVAASQAAMLALSTADVGDVAIRTDISKSFILTATPPATLANWQELLTPAQNVSSVFGRTGAVVATSGDYAVAQVTGAAPLASPALTGTPTAPTAVQGTNTTQLATTAGLMTQAALHPLKANNLSDLANAGTARTNLGLGTMAIQNANAVAITGGTIDGITLDGGTF